MPAHRVGRLLIAARESVARQLISIAILSGLLTWSSAGAALSNADLQRMRDEHRVALVIGNGNYRNFEPLDNPVNDANGVAAALRDAGFEVILRVDATRDDMNAALQSFDQSLRKADVGLFYYAGHAAQVEWRNFMLPVAAALDAQKNVGALEAQVAQESVDLAEVLKLMDGVSRRLNIVILDACRDNPFTAQARELSRSLSRTTGKTPFKVGVGLAQSFAPARTFLAYSTAPGQVASDGTGRNSPYSAALIQALAVPGLKLEDVFKQVRSSVAAATKQEQIPWDNSSVFDDFYFRVPANIEVVNTEPKKRGINTTFVSP
jgi:uncharacterized caspase-like protein